MNTEKQQLRDMLATLIGTLEDVHEALDGYADVRDTNDGPAPNVAMQARTDIERVLAAALQLHRLTSPYTKDAVCEDRRENGPTQEEVETP